MYQIVEGRRYLYTPGSCCLMNRDTLHTEETSTDFICIFFSVSSNFIKMLTNYGNPMLFPQEQHRNTKDFIDFVPRISAKEQKILVHDIFEQMISRTNASFSVFVTMKSKSSMFSTSFVVLKLCAPTK